MKFLLPILLLIPLVLTAPVAGAAGPGHGRARQVEGNDAARRPDPGTVVITGRDGRVTGVERRPGEGRDGQGNGRDREQRPGNGQGGPGGPGGPGGRHP